MASSAPSNSCHDGHLGPSVLKSIWPDYFVIIYIVIPSQNRRENSLIVSNKGCCYDFVVYMHEAFHWEISCTVVGSSSFRWSNSTYRSLKGSSVFHYTNCWLESLIWTFLKQFIIVWANSSLQDERILRASRIVILGIDTLWQIRFILVRFSTGGKGGQLFNMFETS